MSALWSRIGRRRLLAVGGTIVVLAGIGVAIVDPFAGSAAGPQSSGLDNGAPTSTARVERASLSSQAQVSGTLGFAGSWTVSVPAGTSPDALSQAEQAVISARAQLATADAGIAADESNLAAARRTLATDEAAKKRACRGSSSAAGCTGAKQTVSQDEASVRAATQKLVGDRPQLASTRAGLAGAEQALAAAESSATSYTSSSSYTMLAAPGRIVERGQPLYAIDGEPTLLLYGSTPAWRAFTAGMSPGADVAELNANLQALGYGAPSGDGFTAATSAAVSALQQAHGIPPTGALDLGAVVFEPGALRVTTVTPTVGGAVQPGPVLTGTSTRPDVSIQLDAAQQSEVKLGDRVSVILPDNSTTPGVVSAVGKVATVPPAGQQGGGSSSPTIAVDVRLLDAAAAGHFDQAPVEVSITEQTVRHATAVPVDALVALAGGGYAVEVVKANGTHQLVAVRPGLFDDAQGLVQVSGDLAPGERVVVPLS